VFTVRRNHFRGTDKLFGCVENHVLLEKKLGRNKISVRGMFRFTSGCKYHATKVYSSAGRTQGKFLI